MADELKGVLTQHRERMESDPAYREAALTPPGNHPPGGHVDDVQRTADGEPAKGEESAPSASSSSPSKATSGRIK